MSAPLKGLVLAGGRSRRMGVDKAALQVDGSTLLESAVYALSEVVADVYVSIRDDQRNEDNRRRFQLVSDKFSDIGPAAGMLSAHISDPEAAWLILACDMPLVDAHVLANLVAGRASSRDATGWSAASGEAPEPLCTIYEPATLAAFLRFVREGGDPSPQQWLQQANMQLMDALGLNVLASANTKTEFTSLIESRRAGKPQKKNRK